MALVALAVLQPFPPSRRDVDAATMSFWASIIITSCSCATSPDKGGAESSTSGDLGVPICNCRC